MSNMSYRKTRKLLHEFVVEHDKGMAKIREMQAETERLHKESKREHEETKKEHDEAWRKLRQDFERFGISQCEQVEAMFVDLGSKFNEQGFNFPKEAEGRVKFLGENRQVLAEVDKLLENGEAMMAVEVKSKLKKDDVDGHIKRLAIIGEYNKKHGDTRKVLGAVAGGVVADNVLAYAHGKGLYVIVRNGKSVDVAKLPDNFIPKSW